MKWICGLLIENSARHIILNIVDVGLLLAHDVLCHDRRACGLMDEANDSE